MDENDRPSRADGGDAPLPATAPQAPPVVTLVEVEERVTVEVVELVVAGEGRPPGPEAWTPVGAAEMERDATPSAPANEEPAVTDDHAAPQAEPDTGVSVEAGGGLEEHRSELNPHESPLDDGVGQGAEGSARAGEAGVAAASVDDGDSLAPTTLPDPMEAAEPIEGAADEDTPAADTAAAGDAATTQSEPGQSDTLDTADDDGLEAVPETDTAAAHRVAEMLAASDIAPDTEELPGTTPAAPAEAPGAADEPGEPDESGEPDEPGELGAAAPSDELVELDQADVEKRPQEAGAAAEEAAADAAGADVAAIASNDFAEDGGPTVHLEVVESSEVTGAVGDAGQAPDLPAAVEAMAAPAGDVPTGMREIATTEPPEAATEPSGSSTSSGAESLAATAPEEAPPAPSDAAPVPSVGAPAVADAADAADAEPEVMGPAPTAFAEALDALEPVATADAEPETSPVASADLAHQPAPLPSPAEDTLPADGPGAAEEALARADEWDAVETLEGDVAGEWSPEDEAFLAAIATLPDAGAEGSASGDASSGVTVVVIPAPRPTARAETATRPSRARRRRKRRPLLTLIEVVLVLLVAFGATYAILDARARLDNAKLLAHAGLQQIEAVRTLFTGPDKFGDALKPGTLAQAERDLAAAQGDFARLRAVLQAGTFAIAARVPVASGPVGAAVALAAAADEACQGGLLAMRGMELVAPVVAGGFFASGSSGGTTSGGGGLTTATIAQLSTALDGALQHLDTAVGDARQADLAALPASLLSAQQRHELQQALALWPTLRPLAAQVDAFLAGAPALLGLDHPASYLIELMDRTELRPGGGFIGNYAVMTLSQGKVQPFSISDTYLLDKPYLSAHGGYSPSPPAFFWWPWAGYYGLRDSNFAADFPTSAQQGMQELVHEGGPATQGVIALSVPAIARVIDVVGAIPMPLYHQTVTAQNLESLIHYYQEAVGHDPLTGLPRSDLLSSSRKRFTALLARALLDKLHGLSSAQLLALGQDVLTSLRLKEIQVYVSVPPVEGLLTQHGLDGAVTRGPGDGVTVVDANATANKANQFVTTTYHDQVTLDAHGMATHQLTITYQFNAANPALLYGPDLYKTYLRVYVPPGAQLTHLDGLKNLFGDDRINHSDLAWRQMWGGYVIVHNHAPYVLHLSWSVPNAAIYDSATGAWNYRLDYQHQSGASQMLSLSVAVPGQTHPAIQFNAALDADHSFTATYRAG